METQGDRGTANQKNLRPLSVSVEFRCKFFKQPTDIVG